MDLKYMPLGSAYAEFIDRDKRECLLMKSVEKGCIWLGVYDKKMHLNRSQVAELLPYLTCFAKMGKLTEKEPKGSLEEKRLVDHDKRECLLMESAEKDCIWLGVIDKKMHLNRSQVAELLPYLICFAKVGKLTEQVPTEPKHSLEEKRRLWESIPTSRTLPDTDWD
jgi:hypothetical protein